MTTRTISVRHAPSRPNTSTPTASSADFSAGLEWHDATLVPVSANIRSLGLRPSAFIDVGSVWGLTKPNLTNTIGICAPRTGNTLNPITLTPFHFLSAGNFKPLV